MDCSIERPINIKIMPPAKRKEAMVIPKRERISCPVQTVAIMMTIMAKPVVLAVLCCAATADLWVISRKIDNEPKGFIITIMATINLTVSLVIMVLRLIGKFVHMISVKWGQVDPISFTISGVTTPMGNDIGST